MNAARTRLADLITAFFARHLAAERNASSHTIASYRDTFRLLLVHVAESNGRQVSQLTLDDLGPDAILRFLESLEQQRGNSVPTRNAARTLKTGEWACKTCGRTRLTIFSIR